MDWSKELSLSKLSTISSRLSEKKKGQLNLRMTELELVEINTCITGFNQILFIDSSQESGLGTRKEHRVLIASVSNPATPISICRN